MTRSKRVDAITTLSRPCRFFNSFAISLSRKALILDDTLGAVADGALSVGTGCPDGADVAFCEASSATAGGSACVALTDCFLDAMDFLSR